MIRATMVAVLGLLALPAAASDADFQKRCTAAGVLKCIGFDTSADAVPGTTLFKAGDGQYHGSIDVTTRASGAGSLRFKVPSNSGANSSGYWLGDMGRGFGQGQRFHVQWRQRFSRSFLETDYEGGHGWKQIIIHRDGPSCANVQVVLQNIWERGLPVGYSHCGLTGWGFAVDLSNGDTRLQQGDYNCLRRTLTDCARYRPDQWITYYLDVSVGTFNQPNSRVHAYVQYPGEPMKKFIDRNDYTFAYDNGPSDTFRKVQLTPYHTSKSSSQVHPEGYTWYDELIISTQPIAAPGGTLPVQTGDTTPPAAPTSLSFQ